MALYVSKIHGLQIIVRRDTTERVFDDEKQAYIEHTRVPLLVAAFDVKTMPAAARQQARDYFDPRDANENGDEQGPYRRAGVASDPDFENIIYDASDYWLRYSAFDTDDPGQCPLEHKELFEAVLDGDVERCTKLRVNRSTTRNVDYIKIEKPRLPAPWPSYDKIVTKQGVNKEAVGNRIAAMVRDIELDAVMVAEYEKENLARDYVIDALAVLIDELAADAEGDAALRVSQ